MDSSSSKLYLNETPEHRRQRIRNLFDQLDYNNTGYLDVSDLSRRLAEIGSEEAFSNGLIPTGSCETYARELVAACLGTSNGRISFNSFEKFVHNKEEQLWKAFCKLDTSNSQLIRYSELKHALAKADIKLSDSEFKQFMAQIDSAGDGVIDFGEFRDFLLLLPRQPTLENIFGYYQDVYDVDINVDQLPIPPSVSKNSAGSLTSQNFSTRLKYFVAGGISGAFSRTATAPLDRIKVFLQIQVAKTGSGDLAKGQIWSAIKRIYSTDGLRGFYSGNGLNVLKIVPESAIKFTVFENAKTLVHKYENSPDKNHISLFGRFISGGVAGLISQFCIYPIETVKMRVMAQIDVGSFDEKAPFVAKPSPSSLVCRTCSELWNAGGIRLFFRGCVPALIGIVPYSGIDFCVFETLKMSFVHYNHQHSRSELTEAVAPSVPVLLGCGMISGAVGVISMYPVSLIRARLQAQGTPSHPETYSSSWDAIRKTYQRERFIGFYKGLTPTLMKVLPAISLGYVTYEHAKKFFDVS